MDDDQKMKSLLTRAYDSAPSYVQDFLDEDKLGDFMLDLQAETKMHGDTATNVSNQILMTLLGVIEPGELPAELKNAGLDDETVPQVLKKVNDAIFVPLQEEARKGSRATPAPMPRVQATSAPVAPIVPVPAPVSLPTPPPVAPQPLPPPTPAPLPAIVSEPLIPAPAELAMRTMAHDVEAMQSGRAPEPVHYPAPTPIVRETPLAPAPINEPTLSVNQFVRPQPIMPPPPTIPPSQIPATPSVSKTPVPDINEVTGTLQKYGIDPYREAPE